MASPSKRKPRSVAAASPNGRGAAANATEESVLRIISLIREQKLKAGDRIGEISIAKDIGMGRMPTRGALDRLAQAGVLERIPRSGTFIRQLGFKEFSEIMDVRAYLECLSARLAARLIDPARVPELITLAEKADCVNDDTVDTPLGERYHIDTQFHLFVAKMSDNSRLFSLLENQHLLEFSMVSGMHLRPQHFEFKSQTPTHASIAQAIAGHRVEEAGELMREHVIKTKQMRIALSVGDN